MNEFLQNLRSSQKSYSNGNRKNYDGHYYPNRDRRGDFNRRTDTRRQPGKETSPLSDVLVDLMPLVKELVPKFLETFERIAESKEKMILAEERKTEALEKITTSLAEMASSKPQPLAQAVTVQDAPELPLNKETVHKSAEKNRKNVIEIIKTMRDENCTYDHIAQYLTEQQYPTFSHRGEWHAQTVHRLFKKGYPVS